MEESVVGHVIFTRCGIGEGSNDAALLAPLAVAPDRQRQGIGSAIVQAGLQRLPTIGVDQVYVLGDPAYYGRLGFRPEVGVTPPYPLPAEWQEAWQSINLAPSRPDRQGKLSVPRSLASTGSLGTVRGRRVNHSPVVDATTPALFVCPNPMDIPAAI